MSRIVDRWRHEALLSLCLLLPTGIACAQATPEPLGRITGVVRDSVSGVPIVRGFACGDVVAANPINSRMRCGTTNADGRYRIDSMPAGTFTIRVSCTGGTRDLAKRVITVTPGSQVEWNIDVPDVGCDQRPMERIHGRIKGLYYNPDFETSWFFADGRTNQHATADFSHSGKWPDVFRSLPRIRYGLGCVRVTFAGTMHGPLNTNRDEMYYALAVDTIVAARPVPEEECFKVVERFLPSIRSLAKQYRSGG